MNLDTGPYLPGQSGIREPDTCFPLGCLPYNPSVLPMPNDKNMQVLSDPIYCRYNGAVFRPATQHNLDRAGHHLFQSV